MNIEYLHEFFVLAYRLNFSAAAKELHMGQPTLSSHMAALEKELGAALFDRDSQSVSLTPAGKACLQDANDILSSYNSMLRHAHQYSTGRTRKVVIQTYSGNRYLNDVLQAVGTSPAIVDASVEIETRSLSQTDFFSDVQNGDVDMMLILDVYSDRPSNLVATKLSVEPLAAVVPLASPLADRSSISVRDLEGQNVAVAGRLGNHGYAAYVSGILESMGVRANVVEHYYNNVYDQLSHVGKDEIYLETFVTGYNSLAVIAQNCKFIRFEEDIMKADAVAVCRKDNDNPWLGTVIEKLKQLMNASL